MKKYILSLDEGTTSTRAILFDREGKIVDVAQREFTQIYPKPGWVEHDPMEIYANQYSTMTEVIVKSGIDPNEIDSIGITNQRETTIVWNKETGKPVYNAIVWQCRRTAEICEQLKKMGASDYIKKTTGLLIDSYFSGTKIKWILDHVDGARKLAEEGKLLFGTVDTWLMWKLSNGRIHVTDHTNASRTMIYSITKHEWDDEILRLLDIPRSMLPEVKSSGEVYGEISIMGATIPISGDAGDQQAALFGQKCFGVGEVKNTYGTGCFLLMNTGDKPSFGESGLITTCAATEKGFVHQYALEGSVFVGGAVVQWLRDELGFIRDAQDSEYFAVKAKSSGGVYVVPAFTGLGAPYWDMYARGAIVGMTRGSGRNQITRAALESIAYQTDDVIKAMESDTGVKVKVLKADGGASKNRFLMQFQASISNVEVELQSNAEATALGAALLAGLGSGFYKSREDILSQTEINTIYKPNMSDEERTKLLKGWKRAVECASGWIDE